MENNIEQSQLKALYKFSTPEISDALDACGIDGYLEGIKPIAHAPKTIGPAYTIQYQSYEEQSDKTFKQASQYIDEVPAHSIIIIDNHGSPSCSVWGGILTHYANKHHISGTIVNGMVRDKEMIEKYHYPLYAKGLTPQTGKNRARIVNQRCDLSINGVNIKFEDIIFADANGVLSIPKEKLTEILSMAANIADNENKIIQAIDKGKTLKEARENFNYDRPWLKKD